MPFSLVFILILKHSRQRFISLQSLPLKCVLIIKLSSLKILDCYHKLIRVMHFGVHIKILILPVLPKVLRHIHNIQ